MRLLDLPQARYFCSPPPAVIAGITPQSLRDYHNSLSKSVTRIREGTLPFQIHQVSLLTSIERWLLYATSHYRRAMDMLVPASAPWAQVTLYYASFFAANATLGLFGGWVGQTQDGIRVIDVEHPLPGSQELRIYRRLASPSGAAGSHRIFWDFFYNSVASIAAWAPPELAPALTPVNGNFAWQIAERNNVNYDMHDAWTASKLFHGTFRASRLKSLSGPLQLQFEASERLIKLALRFAAEIALSTTALEGVGQTGASAQVRKKLGAQRSPQLITQSAFQEF